MKKRVLAALAAAVLLATASAASADGYVTLAELSKQAAEEGWRQVYEVDGKTLVTDASIKLPSAEACPILRLEPIGRDESDGVFDAYRAQKNAQIAADDKALTVEVINDESRLLVAREDWGTSVVQPSDFYDGEIGLQSTPENVDLTYDELLKRIDGALESLLAVSLSDFQIDTVQVSQSAYEQETGRPLTKMGQYTVTATQLFHGIPLLDGAAHDRPNGQMIYGYSCPDCYSFTFACSKETGVQEEDVPLLPFDAIKAKGQALIDAGKLESAKALTFGYVACKQGDGWAAFPVWRIQGVCAETDGGAEQRVCAYDFNAQTGEMLGMKDEVSVVPSVLTWDDVNR